MLTVLIVLGVIAVPVVLWFGFHAFSRFLTGWKTLAQRFSLTDVHKFGTKYRCSGAVGALRGSWPNYVIEFAQEGFVVTPNFARRSPILVPWSGIREISEVDAGGWGDVVTVTVEYDKLMQFYLSKDALQAIRENVPTERLRKESFSQLIKNRLNNPVKPFDGA
jgi:hypothetical protein